MKRWHLPITAQLQGLEGTGVEEEGVSVIDLAGGADGLEVASLIEACGFGCMFLEKHHMQLCREERQP